MPLETTAGEASRHERGTLGLFRGQFDALRLFASESSLPTRGMDPANPSAMKLDQILVPFDFSACAGLAFDEAVDLASRYGGKLTLLHAFLLNEQVYPYSAILTEAQVDEARDAATGALEQWRDRAEAAGVAIDVRVAPGTPSENISAVAGEVGADLIVMGTHGRTGLSHVLLGSVAERTLRTAPCPVMTVRPQDTAPA